MNNNVKILIGSHGAGKSNWIYNYFFSNAVKKCADLKYRIDLNKKIYLIVPEQDTNDKQRLLMKEAEKRKLGAGIINIDVISFDRLAHNVFDILDIEPENENIIDDDAKTMILALTLSKLNEKNMIKYYSRMINKMGFAKKLTQVVSEFYAYNVKESDIDKVIEESNEEWFKNKLTDLKLIYEEFKKDLKNKNFSIKEDKYNLLSENIDKVNLFDDAIVAFDGFTGFTPVQMDIFKKIVDKSKEVFVSIDIRTSKEKLNTITNNIGDMSDVFYLSKKFINDISKALSTIKKELPIDNYIYIDGVKKYDDKEDFKNIEKYIYSYTRNIKKINAKNVEVFTSKNVDDEIQNVIDTIKKITGEDNYRYSDIKIIVPNISDYRDKFVKYFNKADIPLFIDDTTGLLNSPYIETIRAAIDVVNYDFSYDSVMRYINAGLIEKNEIVYMLDNIILKYGIRGYKRYKNGFNKIPIPEYKKDQILSLKEEIFTPLFTLYEELKEMKKTTYYIDSIKKFINDIKLNEKFEKFCNVFDKKLKNDNDYNRQNKILIESIKVTNKTLNNILIINENNEQTINLFDFKKLLDVGFTDKGVKSIPYLLDQVVVGDLMRSRFDNPKIVFFMGLNQSKVPASSYDISIIDDVMREKFENLQISLSQTTKETALNQRFYIYLALTNATDKMILSYPRFNSSNESDEKSQVLVELEKIFDDLKYKQVRYDTYKNENEIIIDDNNLPIELTKKLIAKNDKDFVGSVSSIEKFNLCPYHFFLEKSMFLSEREEYGIKSIDMGNYFHKVLEIIYKDGFEYNDIDDDKIEKMIDDAIFRIENDEKYKVEKFDILNKNDKDFFGSNKIEFIKQRARKVLISSIKILSKIQNRSLLYCKDVEKNFKYEIEGVDFEGKIDRIETYETDDNVYINILDYKSGNQKISIDDIKAGIKLQLIIYLDYCLSDEYKGKKNAISCGSFYFKLADPIIKIDHIEDKNSIDSKKQKEFSYVGIINSLDNPLKKIDIDGFKITGVTLDDATLKDTITEVRKNIYETVKNINDGVIKIKPYDKKDCAYCPYSTICRIDQLKDSIDEDE